MSEPKQSEFSLEPEYEIADDGKKFEFSGALYTPVEGEYEAPVEEKVVGQFEQGLWVPTRRGPKTMKMHPMTAAYLKGMKR